LACGRAATNYVGHCGWLTSERRFVGGLVRVSWWREEMARLVVVTVLPWMFLLMSYCDNVVCIKPLIVGLVNRRGGKETGCPSFSFSLFL